MNEPTIEIAFTYDELKTLMQSHSLAEERALAIGAQRGDSPELTKRKRQFVTVKLELARSAFEHLRQLNEARRRLKGERA